MVPIGMCPRSRVTEERDGSGRMMVFSVYIYWWHALPHQGCQAWAHPNLALGPMRGAHPLLPLNPAKLSALSNSEDLEIATKIGSNGQEN